MAQYRVKAWTGPTCVGEIASKMRECPGLTDILEGTEHVYATVDGMDAPGAAWNFLVELRLKHNMDYGLKPAALHVVRCSRCESPATTSELVRRIEAQPVTEQLCYPCRDALVRDGLIERPIELTADVPDYLRPLLRNRS